ncbi:multicopper oxidase domain-containing protein [Nocardiopsis algeriensis]|uniref:multicopper oxidase domain-containing protein n=1 Tax=Nocardiopsis algeriensis TaxID=1478215 RepID=UPI003B43D4A7
MPPVQIRIESHTRPPTLPRASWHSRANTVVLAWAALAVLALLFGEGLGLPRWLPVHLFLLGAVTNAIVTWTEHFSVALLRMAQPTARMQSVRLAVLNAGITALIAGAVALSTTSGGVPVLGTALAGAAVVAGTVAWHTGWLVVRARGAMGGRFAHVTRWYTAAGLFLVVAAVPGAVMLFGSVSSRTHEQLIAAHAHAALLGWVGLAVIGTLFTLWPTLLRTRVAEGSEKTAHRTLLPAALGLAATVAGLAHGWRWAAVAGVLVYAAAFAAATAPLVRVALRRRPHTAASWTVLAAQVWFAVALVADAAVISLVPAHEVYTVLRPYVPVFLVGFTGQILLGSLTFLLPVVLGGGPERLMRNSGLVEKWWPARLAVLNTALLLTLLPGVAGTLAWVAVAASVLAFVVLAATAVIRSGHLPRPSATAMGATAGAAATALALMLALSGGGTSEGVEPTGRTRTVEVSLGAMTISPGTVSLDPGDSLVLEVVNNDSQPHDLRMGNGVQTPLLSPGEEAVLEVGVVTGPLEGWCTVMGHRAAGMTMNVVTTGDDVALADAGGTEAGGADAGGEEHGGHAAHGDTSGGIDPGGEWSEGWEPFEAALEPAPGGEVHEVEIVVTESESEVAPGVRQPVWTFGGTVPGPVLRGKLGDVFEITLVNDGTMGHSIDFHAGSLAPDEPMRTIAPGEELTYRFHADMAGAWLYHCSTMPMSHHLGNGMYGAVVVDPPDLPEVDREYLLVQGELYLGEPGGAEQVEKIAAAEPDAWVFNGSANGYGHAPLTAEVDERVRVWVVAAGPSSGTAFHIVGARFDTVYKEGNYLLRPEDPGGSQALDLAPAQGGFVETVFPEAGTYPFVDHDFRHAENGAHGYFEVEDR